MVIEPTPGGFPGKGLKLGKAVKPRFVPDEETENVFSLIDEAGKESQLGGGNLARFHLWKHLEKLFPDLPLWDGTYQFRIVNYRSILLEKVQKG